ncbi:hypothetical protein SAMN05216404_11091 [Nitrosospira multiformis]|uniref:Cytidylate kinase n=2 Tax=Nitrosospira multiformis TaxID=1231 RepID=A0A1H8LG35_9PROT|nr:hypothetical protein SAMN05216404_11091 [Nitrosospira multiformis]
MPGISIDRMSMELTGVTESQARRLAMGITEGLAARRESIALSDVPVVRINLTADAATNTDKLIEQVISEILQELRRLP